MVPLLIPLVDAGIAVNLQSQHSNYCSNVSDQRNVPNHPVTQDLSLRLKKHYISKPTSFNGFPDFNTVFFFFRSIAFALMTALSTLVDF